MLGSLGNNGNDGNDENYGSYGNNGITDKIFCVIVLFSGLGDTLEESTMKKIYAGVKFT